MFETKQSRVLALKMGMPISEIEKQYIESNNIKVVKRIFLVEINT